MFVSAGIDVKFHTYPEDDKENEIVYTPTVRSKITQATWCNDNNYLLVLSEKGFPEIISTRNKRNIKLVHTVQSLDGVSAATFQRTTKRCVSLGSNSGQVALYDTKNRAITKLYSNLNSTIKFLDFNAEDVLMAAACENGTIALYGMLEGEVVDNLHLPSTTLPTAMRFHPELNRSLAAASSSGEIILWDVNSSRKIFYAQSHTLPVTGLAFSSSGSALVSVGQDHKLCIYDLNICECLFRNNLQQPVSSVDMHRNGVLLALGFEDGGLYLYDMRKLIQPIQTSKPHPNRINKIAFSNHSETEIFSEDLNSKTSLVSQINADSNMEDHSKIPADTRSCAEVPNQVDQLCDSLAFQKMREEVFAALHNHMADLSTKMNEHFNKFKSFLDNEFLSIDCAIEDKCNILNIAGLVDESNEDFRKKE